MRALLLVGLTACGRVGFDAVREVDGGTSDSDAAGIQPIHRYMLHENYEDDFGGPSLVPQGGSFVANRYQFGANQGLSLASAMPSDVYTLDMMLSFDVLDGWNKIVDFGDRGPDSGLYTYKSGLQYVIVPTVDFLTTEPRWAVGSPRRLTTTRDASGTVTAYIDGVIALGERSGEPDPPLGGTLAPLTFTDTMRIAALSKDRVWFFVDDTATDDEASGGTVEEIRIYDVALTAQQVAEIR